MRLFGLVCCVALTLGLALPAAADLPQGPVLAKGQAMPEHLVDLYAKGESVFATFDVDGTRLTLQTLRGPMTLQEIRDGDPTAPLYQIDLRIMDEDGYQFVTQVGGHDAMDPEWAADAALTISSDSKELASRAARDFSAAFGAISALKTAKLEPGFEPEMRQVFNLLSLLRRAQEPAGGTHSTDELAALQSKACNHATHIEAYDKSTFFGILGARHSASIVWDVDPYHHYVWLWTSCNHGTCASDSAMSYLCYHETAFNRCSCPVMLMCSTSYGFFSGTHVCNDDTWIQYYLVKYNASPGTSGGTCSDGSLRTRFDCW